MALRLCSKTCLVAALIECFLVLISAAPAIPGVPTPPGDPFAAPMPAYNPVTFYNAPPPPSSQNYVPAPPANYAPPLQNNFASLPQNYAPPPQNNNVPPPQAPYVPPPHHTHIPPPPNQNFGFGGFNPSQLQFPQSNPVNNMVNPNFPPVPPMTNDINKPMPHDAAAAIDSANSFPTSNNAEQEFEADAGATGGMGSPQPYQPPPAYPVQSQSPYNSQPSSSLLDAYYGRPRMQPQAYQRPQNNGLFGGLFGNTPGGNLMGAIMLNELVF